MLFRSTQITIFAKEPNIYQTLFLARPSDLTEEEFRNKVENLRTEVNRLIQKGGGSPLSTYQNFSIEAVSSLARLLPTVYLRARQAKIPVAFVSDSKIALESRSTGRLLRVSFDVEDHYHVALAFAASRLRRTVDSISRGVERVEDALSDTYWARLTESFIHLKAVLVSA